MIGLLCFFFFYKDVKSTHWEKIVSSENVDEKTL